MEKKPITVPERGRKFEVEYDIKSGTAKIPVMEFVLGDGKIKYLDYTTPDPSIVSKLATQYERRNGGVRSMELKMVDKDKFSNLPEEHIAILLVD